MMWMNNNSKNINRKLFPFPFPSPMNNDSLSISEVYRGVFEEEAAFRRLAWPPRSYSCSFCRREFRSAQALGGHMNVHRRDRAARLKHQPSPPPPPPPPPHELQAAAGIHHHHQKHAFYKKRADGEKSVEKRDSLSAGIVGLVDGTAAVVCKRNKQSPLMAAPLFLHSKLVSSTDQIDLELRLGLGFHIHG